MFWRVKKVGSGIAGSGPRQGVQVDSPWRSAVVAIGARGCPARDRRAKLTGARSTRAVEVCLPQDTRTAFHPLPLLKNPPKMASLGSPAPNGSKFLESTPHASAA